MMASYPVDAFKLIGLAIPLEDVVVKLYDKTHAGESVD
jgi:hypothetical protein